MAQQLGNLPAMQETQETWVQTLGREKSQGQRSLADYSSKG